MTKDDASYLRHIRGAIHQIQCHVQGGEAKFMADEMVQDAVIRQLSIIGEAVGQLSDELSEESPSVPWTDIYGTRNKLVHDYFGVDLQAVWDTVQQDLPSLLTTVNALLGGQDDL
ncbi:MAG: hypothetical protein BRD42_06955 [Bacteroidetes bacterium QS_3_64_15]|nr:MAG: hypothetical protein BRD42_06955 [Bacteroidetes bacterium QS_3_64_15]